MPGVETGSIILGAQSLSLIRTVGGIHFTYLTENFWAFISSAEWTSKSSFSTVEKSIYKYEEIYKYFEYIQLYKEIGWWLNLNYQEGTEIK